MKHSVLIIVVFISVVTFLSCKKSNTSLPSNTIQAIINGKTSTFNFGVFATRTGTPGPRIPNYVILLTGLTNSTTLAGSISLGVQGVDTITTATYNENSSTNNASITYINNIDLFGNIFSNGHATSNPFIIVVTSLNSKSIQGTFHGDIFNNGDSAQTLETVTNGKFNVNFN
jgi:hypothetical protein